MALIVNFFGGPSSGKSVLTGGLFYHLKMDHYINCEMAREVAKPLVWNGHEKVLEDQDYVTACQRQIIEQLKDKVDVVICDSPLLLGMIYAPDHYPDSFKDFTLWTFNQYTNLNFFVNRNKPFDPSGRRHTEEESISADKKIKDILNENSIPYFDVLTNGLDTVVQMVVNAINDGQ